MGSLESKHLDYREGWAFIGIKGMKKMSEKRAYFANTNLILGYGKIVKKTVRKTKTVEGVTKKEKVVKEVAQKVKGGSRIEVQSAGRMTGNYASINVSGNKYVVAEKSHRGWNVIALDAKNHKLIMDNYYDMYGDKEASSRFVQDFNNLPTASVIVVGIKDEGSKRVDDKVKEIFGKMGSKEVFNLSMRDAWGFIGVKGQ